MGQREKPPYESEHPWAPACPSRGPQPRHVPFRP